MSTEEGHTYTLTLPNKKRGAFLITCYILLVLLSTVIALLVNADWMFIPIGVIILGLGPLLFMLFRYPIRESVRLTKTGMHTDSNGQIDFTKIRDIRAFYNFKNNAIITIKLKNGKRIRWIMAVGYKGAKAADVEDFQKLFQKLPEYFEAYKGQKL